MDAYNQGYNSGILGVGNLIGDATRIEQALPSGAQSIGFYASAYTLGDGSKVISYRGTDNMNPLLAGNDVWNGYSIQFGGTPGANQAGMAIEFYK